MCNTGGRVQVSGELGKRSGIYIRGPRSFWRQWFVCLLLFAHLSKLDLSVKSFYVISCVYSYVGDSQELSGMTR